MILYRCTFKDDYNQSVTQRLVKEVLAQNHSFEACDIRSKLNSVATKWYIIIIHHQCYIFKGQHIPIIKPLLNKNL